MHDEFINAALKYKGQIVNIQYYDPNNTNTPVVNERVVISSSMPTHLIVISAYNSSLVTRGLALPLIEYIASPDGKEVIQNPNYEKPKTL